MKRVLSVFLLLILLQIVFASENILSDQEQLTAVVSEGAQSSEQVESVPQDAISDSEKAPTVESVPQTQPGSLLAATVLERESQSVSESKPVKESEQMQPEEELLTQTVQLEEQTQPEEPVQIETAHKSEQTGSVDEPLIDIAPESGQTQPEQLVQVETAPESEQTGSVDESHAKTSPESEQTEEIQLIIEETTSECDSTETHPGDTFSEESEQFGSEDEDPEVEIVTEPEIKTIDEISMEMGYDIDVFPVHYDLKIDLDSENETFTGTVRIECEFKIDTDWLMVNAEDMVFKKVLFDGEETAHHSLTRGNLNIDCLGAKSGAHLIEIQFEAEINRKNEGFYISKYGDKKMFSTLFEPVDARKAFPCFDHPKMKATFDITISADEKYTILSNMPAETETVKESRKTIKFKKMPKTPTYLVAFVVGELEKIQSGKISVYCTQDPQYGQYALQIAVKCLEFYEKYFDIPYPLEKLDMVGIPEFSCGAMENWGLITYRETSLLYNKQKATIYQKEKIARTVTHELAHQWFGNLVTPVWWDDLWLNEGFATWAAALACEAIRKSEAVFVEELENESAEQTKLVDWKPWLLFITDDLGRGLDADVLESSHPIKNSVNSADQINQIFDGISYCKAATLIRMIEDLLTPEGFRQKISKYLKAYAWSNATSDDLFDILSDENFNIKEMMNVWTTRTGFPLVTLTEDKLKQTRMFLDKDKNEENVWILPIKIRIMEEGLPDEIKLVSLGQEMDVSDILSVKNDDGTVVLPRKVTIFLNDGGLGFYRSFYGFESEIFDKIAGMSPENRLIFVNDQVALVKAQRIKLAKMMELCKKFDEEESPEVLTSITSFLLEMKHILYGQSNESVEIIKNLISQRLSFSLTEQKESEVMKLRGLLVSLAVEHGLEISIPENCHPMYLQSYYVQYFDQNKDLELYLRCYQESTSEIQNYILYAMAMTTDFEIYKKIVDLLLSNEIKQQDKTRLAISLVNNLEFKEYMISYFIENFILLNEKISYNIMMYIIEQVAAWALNFEHFSEEMEKYDLSQFDQPYKRGLEKAKFRSRYRSAFTTGMV